ncbi:hypothetical protein HMN09_00157900 [Mycena chlorophos]|uniref:Uncharacterized protein n=1 Tax=Mycena chlorophos TaxID=658473 RepID=A0A8H6TP02_MYCCL|nr:hypothetical protein HMN09_00157900 [Mycena chlorophos]
MRQLEPLLQGFFHWIPGAKTLSNRYADRDRVDMLPVRGVACKGCVSHEILHPTPNRPEVLPPGNLVPHMSATPENEVLPVWRQCAMYDTEPSTRAKHLLACPHAVKYRYLAYAWLAAEKEKRAAKEERLAASIARRAAEDAERAARAAAEQAEQAARAASALKRAKLPSLGPPNDDDDDGDYLAWAAQLIDIDEENLEGGDSDEEKTG